MRASAVVSRSLRQTALRECQDVRVRAGVCQVPHVVNGFGPSGERSVHTLTRVQILSERYPVFR